MALAIRHDRMVDNSSRLAGLRDEIDALAAEELNDVPAEVIGEELVALRRQIDRLEAEFSRRLAHFNRLNGHLRSGAANLVAWLRDRCRLSTGEASRRVEVMAELGAIPEAEGLFQRGEISVDHAVALARTVSQVGREAALIVGPQLVDAAHQLDPSQLRMVCRNLRFSVDPKGALADHLRDHARRRVSLSQAFDGAWLLDGQLDAEGGALVRTALDALSRPTPDDVRTAPQRRADALVELASRQLQNGLPRVGGQRPHVVLTASASALQKEATDVAELASVGAIPTDTARRLACDATVAAALIGEKGEPLAVGRSRRSMPAAIRRAVAIRDRGCRFPGCDRPEEWTSGHHVKHWGDAGETAVSNLVLLCRFHHTMVHEGGWSISMDSNGLVLVRPPP